MLGRWLVANRGAFYGSYQSIEASSMRKAYDIISLLDEIEQAFWVTKQEADSLTHAGEMYEKEV